MKTLFGIPVYINYDRIPEEEYVDFVRKKVNINKRSAILYIFVGIATLVAAAMLVTISFALLDDVGPSLAKGFSIGVMLGIMTGIIFLFAAFMLYLGTAALRGNRTEKLLLEYYDKKC